MMTVALLLTKDTEIRDTVSKCLEESGIEVLTSDSGDGGLADVHDKKPGIVVMDMNLDRVSGLDFLTLLHFLTKPGEMKVVVVDEAERVAEELKDYGVDAVVGRKGVVTQVMSMIGDIAGKVAN